MLYIRDARGGRQYEWHVGEWHVGEKLPSSLKGHVMTFQADGDELDLILDSLKSSGQDVRDLLETMGVYEPPMMQKEDGIYMSPSLHHMLDSSRFTAANFSQTCSKEMALKMIGIYEEGLELVPFPYMQKVYTGIAGCYRARIEELEREERIEAHYVAPFA